MLTTGQEPLNIGGETVHILAPLRTPTTDAGHADPVMIMQFSAVQMFSDRAHHALTTFSIDRDTADDVAWICDRLDGLPPAVQIAAARVKVLSVQEIAAGLNDRFTLLKSLDRTLPERQRTTRTLMDWSFQLLDDSERATLRRLTVLASSFSLDALWWWWWLLSMMRSMQTQLANWCGHSWTGRFLSPTSATPRLDIGCSKLFMPMPGACGPKVARVTRAPCVLVSGISMPSVRGCPRTAPGSESSESSSPTFGSDRANPSEVPRTRPAAGLCHRAISRLRTGIDHSRRRATSQRRPAQRADTDTGRNADSTRRSSSPARPNRALPSRNHTFCTSCRSSVRRTSKHRLERCARLECTFDDSRRRTSMGSPRLSPSPRFGSSRTAGRSRETRRRASWTPNWPSGTSADSAAGSPCSNRRRSRSATSDSPCRCSFPRSFPRSRSVGGSTQHSGVRDWRAKAHKRRSARASLPSGCPKSVLCRSLQTLAHSGYASGSA